MSGHTPGPWSHWYSDGSWHVGADSEIGSLFTGRQENQLNGNCEPDARLIAAAPDLLAALEKGVTRLETNLGDERDMGRGTMTYLLEMFQEAIDRAKGLTSS